MNYGVIRLIYKTADTFDEGLLILFIFLNFSNLNHSAEENKSIMLSKSLRGFLLIKPTIQCYTYSTHTSS